MRRSAAVAVLVMLASCPRAPVEVRRPTVEVVRAERTGVVELRVTNWNDYAVRVSAVDWELWLDGVGPERGRELVEIGVEARGRRELVMSLPGAEGARGYRLRVTLHVESRSGDVVAIVDVDGRF